MEEMRLSYNQIEHALTLRSILDALPRLRLLDLSHNRIVDILFGTLRGHPTLEILLLNDNQITRIGQEALSGMPSLRELNLRNNSLTSHLDFPIWNLPSLKVILTVEALALSSLKTRSHFPISVVGTYLV